MNLGKERTPPTSSGIVHGEFRDWAFKLEGCIVDATCDYGANIMTWAATHTDATTGSRFDDAAVQHGWAGAICVEHT